jgi:U32 family peptidase
LTGRKANRGECTHPCRWKYSLMEENREGKYYPVVEDDRGLYIFNNKDLALFPFIKELTSIGVNSFKIEGRMKTIHYISSVVSLYRRILDGENISEKEGVDLLSRVNNRGYSYGFVNGKVTPEDITGIIPKLTLHRHSWRTLLKIRIIRRP